MLKIIERTTAVVLFVRLLAEGIAWGALAALGIMCLILVSTALGEAHAAADPAPGMTCTYANQGRTYTVEVTGFFRLPARAPWLWVKRPGQGGHEAVIVPPETLSGCRA